MIDRNGDVKVDGGVGAWDESSKDVNELSEDGDLEIATGEDAVEVKEVNGEAPSNGSALLSTSTESSMSGVSGMSFALARGTLSVSSSSSSVSSDSWAVA